MTATTDVSPEDENTTGRPNLVIVVTDATDAAFERRLLQSEDDNKTTIANRAVQIYDKIMTGYESLQPGEAMQFSLSDPDPTCIITVRRGLRREPLRYHEGAYYLHMALLMYNSVIR